MTRDIRRKSTDDSGGKDNLQEQIDAAFEVYWDDHVRNNPALLSEVIPGTIKAKYQKDVRDTFSSGFSAAYASYIVAMHALRK
jgi:hypothetical protein